MLKKAVAWIVLSSLVAAVGLSQDVERKGRQDGQQLRPKFSSLQKSLLVPGWGQITEKRYLEGVLFLSAEAFCLTGIFHRNHQGNEYYRLYKSAETTQDAILYRGLTEQADKRRNILILAAAGVWAVNLIDMSLIIKKHGKGKTQLDVKANVSPDQGLSVRSSVRF